MNLLKLKHWQLFALMISPIVIAMNLPYPGEVMTEKTNDIITQLLGIISYSIQLIWMYQIGIYFQKNIPSDKQRNVKVFKYSFLVLSLPTIFCFTILLYSNFILNKNWSMWHDIDNPILLAILIILWICSIFAYVYIFYHTAQTLLLVQNLRWPYNGLQTTLLLFYAAVVGFWLLQPKINKYIEQKEITTQ